MRDMIASQYADKIDNCSLPRTTLEYTVFEAKLAVKAAIKSKGECTFRRCKDLTASISLDGRNIRNGVIYQSLLVKQLKKYIVGEGKTKAAIARSQKSQIDNIIKRSRIGDIGTSSISKLVWDRQHGKWTLFVPETIEKQEVGKLDEVVAIDPGVRTLATFYSEKYSGAIGDGWYPYVIPLVKRADKLLERANVEREYYKRAKMKKQAAGLRRKAQNVVKDMQHKTALFFARNFQVIILPVMKTSQIVGAGLPKAVSRCMMISSQFRFRQMMIHKAEQYGVNLILCKEYYTSKTCTRCGNLKQDLGSNKVYNCEKCGLSTDRDYNGARNIMLKHITNGGAAPVADQ